LSKEQIGGGIVVRIVFVWFVGQCNPQIPRALKNAGYVGQHCPRTPWSLKNAGFVTTSAANPAVEKASD
jgi:hypothetical protein